MNLQSWSKRLGNCVSGEENVIQVDPLPPEQCWVLQQVCRHESILAGGTVRDQAEIISYVELRTHVSQD